VTRLPSGNRATVQPLPDDLPDDLPGDLLDELDAFLMQASYDEIDPVTRRISDRQLYTLVASEPFIRRDGRQTVLAIWQSHCAQCGQCFEFKRPTRAVKFQPNRRCQLHKRPGVRVSSPRKHRK
jgi:hypothetical protein